MFARVPSAPGMPTAATGPVLIFAVKSPLWKGKSMENHRKIHGTTLLNMVKYGKSSNQVSNNPGFNHI